MGSLYSANFRLYRTFHGHHKAINCLRFNQDSDLLASAGDDGQIIIWDLKKNCLFDLITPNQGPIIDIRWLCPINRAVGEFISFVCSSSDGTVQLWGKPGHRFELLGSHIVCDGSIQSMALEGMNIAIVTPGRLFIMQVKLHEDQPLKVIITDPSPEKPRSRGFMRDAHFIDGGRALLVCYLDTKEVVVWNVNPWRRIWQCPVERRIGNSDWSPTSNALAIWNLQNGVDVYRFTDTCKHVRWGFYGQCVISGSHKGKIYIWGTQTGKTLQVLRHGKGSQIVQTIGYSSSSYNRHMVASASQPTNDSERPIIKVWEADSHRTRQSWQGYICFCLACMLVIAVIRLLTAR